MKKLSLNLRKTKYYMLFHHHNKKLPNNISLQINSTEIERVTNFIFLGVTINEHLSWKPHIDIICSKISKYIGRLNKLLDLPQHILRILYCSVVQSHLRYAILTWGFDCVVWSYYVQMMGYRDKIVTKPCVLSKEAQLYYL